MSENKKTAKYRRIIKNSEAHIDFLIDKEIRDRVGITGRDLDMQVLRLCGEFNDLNTRPSPWTEIKSAADLPEAKVKHIVVYNIKTEMLQFWCWYNKQKDIESLKKDYTHWRPITLPKGASDE